MFSITVCTKHDKCTHFKNLRLYNFYLSILAIFLCWGVLDRWLVGHKIWTSSPLLTSREVSSALTRSWNCSFWFVTLTTMNLLASLPRSSSATHSQGPESLWLRDSKIKTHSSLLESTITLIPLISSSGSYLVPLGLNHSQYLKFN